jgi:hypothetical protein
MSCVLQHWIENMLNANPDSDRAEADPDAVESIARTGARGALTLVVISTAVVMGTWLAFYVLVFLPRSVLP